MYNIGKSVLSNRRSIMEKSSPTINGDLVRVVIVGGGTGIVPVIEGLKKYGGIDLTIITTPFDSGGDSGVLRDQYGILPPGDLRRALIALQDPHQDDTLRVLFAHRYDDGPSTNKSLGNMIMASAVKLWGEEEANRRMHSLLMLKGRALPASLDHAHLVATLNDGEKIIGEGKIGKRNPADHKTIIDLSIEPDAFIYRLAEEAILKAHHMIVGPGSVYTSLIANMLIRGMTTAIKHSRARVSYVVNLMTDSETQDFTAPDFPELLLHYRSGDQDKSSLIGRDRFDAIFVNTKEIPEELAKKYSDLDGSEPVLWNAPAYQNRLSLAAETVVYGDFLNVAGDLIRHDGMRLSRAIRKYIADVKASAPPEYVVDLDHTLARTSVLNDSHDNLEALVLEEGALEFLKLVKGRVTILSAGNTEIQEKKIDILGIREYLKPNGVIIVDEAAKKHGAIAAFAMELINRNGHAIIIGDRVEYEIKAGNFFPCFVTIRIRNPTGKYNNESPQDEHSTPKHDVNGFRELMKILPQYDW